MSIKIALAGNPNCGKTTIFNALTGSNQFVGNWPGVTVEKKEGKLKKHDGVIITDLPGIYSLSPYTPEEIVARNYLLNEHPDAILNIIDGTNLERNLYLTTQLTELGIPVVAAVNMMDIVRKKGDIINFEQLSKAIGCRVVEISALKNDGVAEAAEAAISAAESDKNIPKHVFSGLVEHTLAHIEEAAIHDMPDEIQRWYAIKIFERDEKVLEQLALPQKILNHIEKDIQAVEIEMDDDAEAIITNERYDYITRVIGRCLVRKNKGGLSASDKIDRIVTNRWLALPIFAAVMFLVYYISMITVGAAATDWANNGLFGDGFYLFGIESESMWITGIPVLAENMLGNSCPEWLHSLLIDGIIGGVGAVLGFVPQMLVLFLLLAFIESCGYMSRVAFVLDRIFRRFGLSGKSFIPILIGTGCGVPGIMASRTIENPADRRMTIITTTFIPCSAKTPLIAMIAGAIFGGSVWVAISAYFLGMAAIILSGIILKKTKMFAGQASPFVMELPPYHMPTVPNLLRSMWERGWSFIKKAGTVILLSTVVIWFLTYFGTVDGSFRMLSEDELDRSILATIGKCISWIFIPIGWGDWQSAVATVTGLVAKENVVGSMGILFGSGDIPLYEALGEKFTAAAGYSFLAFNLLCAPCFAAIAAISREMNSTKWTFLAVGYQCIFAYVTSFVIYQLGTLLAGSTAVSTIVGAVISIAISAAVIRLIFKPCDGR